MKKTAARAVAALAIAALTGALAACGSPSENGGPTQLTLWHNYGTYSNAQATDDLVAAFEAENPDIEIDVVSQPQDSYYPLLQSASLSGSGPDLAVMWTGLYAQKYAAQLVNLKGLVPDETLANERSIEYTAPGFDAGQGSLVMPSDTQYYTGFYNKSLLAQAGVTQVPTTWDELYDACDKLKAIGVTPLTYGNGGATGATFVPWYDASYLIAAILSPEQLSGLYSGEVQWTDPAIVDQLAHWQELSTRGCVNDDVLTSDSNFRDFEGGSAAMIIDGSFDAAAFSAALGDDLAAFAPPFSDEPVSQIVEFAGGGYSILKSSKHKEDAAKFLEFVASPEGSAIFEANGLIPNQKDYTPTDPLALQLTGFANDEGYTRYPMLDNVIQPEVADVGSRQLPSVLAGSISPLEALQAMQQTLDSLPEDQRTAIR